MQYANRVAAELIHTERTYVRDLREVIEGYKGYILQHSQNFLSEDDLQMLFINIDHVYEFNRYVFVMLF